jgi:putative transposase
MAKAAVAKHGVGVSLACVAFGISETCYRYQAKGRVENDEIAHWLERLTDNNRNWGFGLCYLYLRNVKHKRWNHKRVYRIYRELELNLRIKPKKRMVREKPATLAVPESINQVWSMDFMHDQLSNGRSISYLTSLMTSIARRWTSRSISRFHRSRSFAVWSRSFPGVKSCGNSVR